MTIKAFNIKVAATHKVQCQTSKIYLRIAQMRAGMLVVTLKSLKTNLNQFGNVQLQSQLTDKIRHKSYKIVFLIRRYNIASPLLQQVTRTTYRITLSAINFSAKRRINTSQKLQPI